MRLKDVYIHNHPSFVGPPQIFTSAGGNNIRQTFTLSEPVPRSTFDIVAVSGPTFVSFPEFPALRVVDFQVVGELEDNGPNHFNVRR